MSDDSLNQWDAYAMQDCIKGLTKERDNWKEAYRSISNDLNLLLCENDELKAKLAVAVETLGIAAEWLDDYSAFTGNTYETTKSKTVRVAIAKIKGEQP